MGDVDASTARRNAGAIRESKPVDLGAGLLGLLAGLAVGPLADRLATNAPVHAPLLGRVPFSPRLPLVTAGTALLGAASGLAYGFTFEAAIAAFFCWVLVIVTRTDFEHRLIPDRIVLPGAVLVATARTIDEPSWRGCSARSAPASRCSSSFSRTRRAWAWGT